jgi:serine/threonine-protein kinase
MALIRTNPAGEVRGSWRGTTVLGSRIQPTLALPSFDRHRLKEVFAGARAVPACDRQAYLSAACAGNEALRQEVESLLASDERAKSFLESPAMVWGEGTPDSAPFTIEGRRLGPYQVQALLGAGGMGQVYRAHDLALNRDVAVKFLPDALASNPDRLARLTREAQALASLNHPNIAAIYGLEESEGVRALVMELVEGEDLSQRIAREAIPLAEALPIAKQIAEALEAAHARGIIHRDVKPANIKVRADGAVKVLDFGLAKATAPRSSAAAAALANSPPITPLATLTATGVIPGTPAYMSPEQAKGRAADRRSDVWAFGVVLYEMLTGQHPLKGDDVSETSASVLTRQPDWTVLPAAAPAPIRRLLRRCLEKDPTRRLADMADARLDIDDALSGSDSDTPVVLLNSRTRERLIWTSLLLLVGLAAAVTAAWVTRPVSVPLETTRTVLSVAPTGDTSGMNPLEQRGGAARPTRTAVALSPDGKTLVFGTIWGGLPQLYARALDRLSAIPISGTSGGYSPFFSPDGQWVGFAANGELRKVPLSGGPAVTLCKAASLFGASWGDDGTIVFATQRNGGLWRVPAAGGIPEPLTTPQPGEYSHRLPHMLPGSRAVIFTILKGPNSWDNTQIVVRSLATSQQTVLVTGGADGRYVSTGHLVYVRLGTLMAVPFDPARLAVTGGATGVIDGVMQAADRNLSYMHNTLAGQLAVSDTGALVYLTGGAVAAGDRSLVWVDRHGTSQALPAPPRSYYSPRLSPDGQRVAVFTLDPVQVWSVDVARGALSRITVDGQSDEGVFTPDGKRIVFRSGADGSEGSLYWKAADGSGAVERLTTGGRSQTPSSWSPDGTTLAFVEEGESTGLFQFDIWVLTMSDRKTRPLIHTAASEVTPEFSPDGRWLAYMSNESGRNEVYVQPYPGPGERHLISTNGGEQPAWSRNGRELFYVQGGSNNPSTGALTLMSVRVERTPAFRAGTPAAVFERADLLATWGRNYDVASDGQRFLLTLNKNAPTAPPWATTNLAPTQMILVQHWFEELKRLVPTK